MALRLTVVVNGVQSPGREVGESGEGPGAAVTARLHRVLLEKLGHCLQGVCQLVNATKYNVSRGT